MTSLAPHLFRSGDFELPLIPDGDSFRVNGAVVARQLGFTSAKDMMRSVPDDGKLLLNRVGKLAHPDEQGVWFLTEPGFYMAVGQRNLNYIKDEVVRAAVAAFQRWVFYDVVPAMVRTGHASDLSVSGTTWSWDDVAAELRQRYGLDYKPAQITRALRAAGWLKDGCTTPKHEHRWKFWHTGTAFHLFPHVLPDLVLVLVPTMQQLGDPQAQQYQLDVLPAPTGLKAVTE